MINLRQQKSNLKYFIKTFPFIHRKSMLATPDWIRQQSQYSRMPLMTYTQILICWHILGF